MSISWSGGGYDVLSWRVFRVDPLTWADGEQLRGVNEVTVDRSAEGTIERGELSVDSVVGGEFTEGYYRIAMTASQGGEAERVDVATLLCVSTSDVTNRGVSVMAVTGRSVLHPASTKRLAIGSYAPKGVDGAAYCADMLRDAINAPVEAYGSFTLDDHVVFDAGISVLDAVWLVLDAGNFVLQISGDGTVSILPKPTEPSLDLDLAHARLMQPEVSRELDWSEVPNRYFAVDNGVVAAAVNDRPESETSTVRRRWCSDVVDESPTRVDGESLRAYAERRLEELSMVRDSRTYRREWWPGVYPFSVIRGSISSVGMEGDFRVESQHITCGTGIVVEEKAFKEVYSWRRT